LAPGKRAFELATGALRIGHAYLATDGIDILYVAYRVSHKVVTLRLGVGSMLPICTTSIGKACLWALPPEQQRALIDEHKRHTGTQGEALDASIRASFAELESGCTCAVLGGFQRRTYGVALPIRVGRQGILMSLSCGSADVKFDLESQRALIAPALKDMAARRQNLLAGIDGLL
jgi:DNA-binding IclR family transcriptional regulator